MEMLRFGSRFGLLMAALGCVCAVPAQQAPVTQPPTAPAGEPVNTAPASTGDAPQTPTQTPTQIEPPAPVPQPKSAPAQGKKAAYTGPNTIVELPATPMLDEEGRQRLDPDGKPIFNPPAHQQRDKKGHPVFDDAGKPVMQTATDLGYDEKGHRIKGHREKEPKTATVEIERGTLTVDGMTGKAGLNYHIAEFRYIYLYAPWVGLTVVSNEPFPGAKEEKNAFDGNTLTVAVADHTFQVYSDKRLLDKKPHPAYVLVDRNFSMPTKFPVMGYGAVRTAPYAWPGSKPNPELKNAAVQAPPLPQSLRPVALLSPCPAGQMRLASGPRLPGDTSPPPPCVPIPPAMPLTAPPATPSIAPAALQEPAPSTAPRF